MILLECSCLSTWIQFGLAFIGVIVSAIALIEACIVRKEVVSQQFKIKQQEEMAQFVYMLNIKVYYIQFRTYHSGAQDSLVDAYMNLKGMTTSLKDKKGDFIKYGDGLLSYVGESPIDSLTPYWGNPYLPTFVSKSITNIMSCINVSQDNNKSEHYVRVLNTGKEPWVPSKEIYLNSKSLNCTLNTFVHNVSSLITSCEKWYKKELKQKNYHLPSTIQIVGNNKKKK